MTIDASRRSRLIRRTCILLLALCLWVPLLASAHEPNAVDSNPGSSAPSSAKAFGHADSSLDGAARPVPAAARPLSLRATEVTLNAVADTMVSSGEPSRNFGKASAGAEDEGLLIGGDDRANKILANYRGLVRFDLSSLPAGAYILSARLVVYHVIFWDYENFPTRSIEVYRSLAGWSETAVNWSTQPERSPTAACSIYIPSGPDQTSFGPYQCDLSTSEIQVWMSGESPNYGFVLSDSTGESEKVFRGIGTREAGTRYVTKLVISYTLDAPTATSTRGSSATPRPTATRTRTPLPSSTATRTNTPLPTATRTNTPTPRPPSIYLPFGLNGVAIPTNLPTSAPSSTPSPRPISTPAPTRTPGGDITWRRRAAVGFGRSNVGVAADDRGFIYAVGGSGSASQFPPYEPTFYRTVEVYQPSEFSWMTRADIRVARDAIAVAALGRRIFAVGGIDGGGLYSSASNAVEEYDPSANTWTARAALPSSAGWSGAAYGSDNKLYVFGGVSYYISDIRNPLSRTRKELDSVYVYDPAQDKWSERAPMPRPIDAPAVAAAPNQRIYVISGTDLYEYDPLNDVWETKRKMPTFRTGLGAAAAADGLIYAVGGTGSDGKALATVEEYDPATDTWAHLADMPTARGSLRLVASGKSIFAVTGSSLDEGVLP